MPTDPNSAVHKNSTPASLLTKVVLRAGVDAKFSSWHAKMFTAAAEAPGFISAEVNGPGPGHQEWSVVQHFRSAADLKAWRASERHRTLLQEASALADGADGAGLREDEVAENALDGVITEVVTTFVRPGKEREYQEWAEKIHQVEAQFPGYRGGVFQPPPSGQQGYWTTLVRFASPEQLDVWLNSPVRANLLKDHEALVQSWEHHRLPSSFAGWFPTEPATGESPPSWKQSLLVIVMLFPIVALELRFLSPLLSGLNASLGTFIGNVISVFLLAWPGMPMIIAAMNWWLLPRKDSPEWGSPAGVVLLAVIYAVEITAFSYLL